MTVINRPTTMRVTRYFPDRFSARPLCTALYRAGVVYTLTDLGGQWMVAYNRYIR